MQEGITSLLFERLLKHARRGFETTSKLQYKRYLFPELSIENAERMRP